MKFKTLLIPLMIIPAVTNAAQMNYCLSKDAISKNVETCDDNDIYGDAGIVCLKQFEKKIQQASTGAALAIDSATANKKDTQANNLGSAKVTYQISVATLNLLIAEGEKRAKEAESYAEQLVWPEDADADFVQDLEKFLKDDPCYADNAKVLSAVSKHFEKNIADLKRARDIAVQNQNNSATSETNIKIDTAAKVDIIKDGKAPAPKIKAVPKPGGSTISGETEKQKLEKGQK